MAVGMIEENRQKYLDMLTTKLFLNEEDVVGLTKGSMKRIATICPFCLRQRISCYSDISKSGHTLCTPCSRILRSSAPLIGTKKGRLLIYDFASPYKGKEHDSTKLKVICECGAERECFAADLKRGRTLSCGCLNKEITSSMAGPLNPNWDPTLTKEERSRGRAAYNWANAVKERDEWECQVCFSKENVVAHHLNSYKHNEELRHNVENGITLCRDCHTDFHVNFMGGYRVPCTSEDFEEYLMQV